MNIKEIKKAKTKYIGKNILYYKNIESTHNYAKEIALKEKNGEIIIAEVQTAGIGTNGKTWHSEDGKNILMTIILKPKYDLEKLNGITVKIADIMKETIKNLYGYELKIKNPNDLILNDKKICGILTQISTQKGKINYLLISLGFNVNEIVFSKETKNIATSLKNEYKKDFRREDIIIKFIENLEKEIEI